MSEELVAGGEVRLVLTTCPDEATARAISRALVEERLAACGNVVPNVTSIYRWKGAIEEAGEVLLLLKIPADGVPSAAVRLRELHPYELPEVLVLEIEAGSAEYLRWVVQETRVVEETEGGT